MTILLTGAAGFIGSHVSHALLARGERVLGVDNMNDFYRVQLKRDRLAPLLSQPGFRFIELDISDREAFNNTLRGEKITRVIHLAAQAGVRYSIDHPFTYTNSNVTGHLVVLEYCRHLESLEHLVYASSSSVYGGNTKLPFSESDPVSSPISLYAATKLADEQMSHAYSHLYRLPQTGLRFFTVYGPWGRPDMAIWMFTEAILAGKPIHVFNQGDMRRDFTYIDDIVAGVVACFDRPPVDAKRAAPHRIYNIGNNRSEKLTHMIALLEKALGREAQKIMEPMQPGDVPETFADINAIQRDHGFSPATSIEAGLPRFVEWYKNYHGL